MRTLVMAVSRWVVLGALAAGCGTEATQGLETQETPSTGDGQSVNPPGEGNSDDQLPGDGGGPRLVEEPEKGDGDSPTTGIRCGNGRQEPGEACDDGPDNSDTVPDACRTDCRTARCGDGVVDSQEACDGGDDADADGCRADCTLPVCGDGMVDADEACDDGDLNSDEEPDACRTDCSLPVCGDAVVDAAEQCDTGAARSDDEADGCRTDCTSPACGDGVTDTGEACDDGNDNDSDDCRNDCSSPGCGDGALDDGEQCDDGNRESGDGCQANCLLPTCGDGVVDTTGVAQPEECDDGNQFDNDGCRSDCTEGCVSSRECTNGLFCDGEETCVDGRCQDGVPAVVDDGVSCTADRCDEDADQVVHAASDDACQASAPQCRGGSLTTYAAMCSPTEDCQQMSSERACDDRPSRCEDSNGGPVLTTYTPACANGSSCGEPAASEERCTTPEPTCSNDRVARVFRATCDPAAETCGSELASETDCKERDSRTCIRGGTAHRTRTGVCDGAGGCSTESNIDSCDSGAASCTAGVLTTFGPTCDDASGCGAPQQTGTRSCPADSPSCEYDAEQRLTYTVQTPTCADGRRCGDPVEKVAVCDASPTCASAEEAQFWTATCDKEQGCGRQPAGGAKCDPTPVNSCEGNVLVRTTSQCVDGVGCESTESRRPCPRTCSPDGEAVCGRCAVDDATGEATCDFRACLRCLRGQKCVEPTRGNASCQGGVIFPPRPVPPAP